VTYLQYILSADEKKEEEERREVSINPVTGEPSEDNIITEVQETVVELGNGVREEVEDDEFEEDDDLEEGQLNPHEFMTLTVTHLASIATSLIRRNELQDQHNRLIRKHNGICKELNKILKKEFGETDMDNIPIQGGSKK